MTFPEETHLEALSMFFSLSHPVQKRLGATIIDSVVFNNLCYNLYNNVFISSDIIPP